MATWTEAEYLEILRTERRLYAWVMHRHGGLTQTQAETAALARYPYETAEAPFRGLIFHDPAWHWAMSALHGQSYWSEHPELAQPSAEYLALE